MFGPFVRANGTKGRQRSMLPKKKHPGKCAQFLSWELLTELSYRSGRGYSSASRMESGFPWGLEHLAHSPGCSHYK
jgi:hypothetical protein